MQKHYTHDGFGREGLTAEAVVASRNEHGENVLSPPKKTPWWKLYLSKYSDPIIQILLVAAAVSLLLSFVEGKYIETIGIFAAVFIATTVGFVFEYDAGRKFDVLLSVGEEQLVKVRRDGKVREIPRRDVVVGDVVMVEVGDEIPADGIIMESVELQVNESALTGELVVSKGKGRGSDADAYPSDMLLRSTMVMSGKAEYVVTAVGDETEIGHVSRKALEQTWVKTPLNEQLDRLAKKIGKIGTVVAGMVFCIFFIHDFFADPTLWQGRDYVRMAEMVLTYFMMAVSLIVMAVPEGLPMAVNLSLALNMRRMLKSNNLVRKLHACETIGSVNVICTDKTGTLTENRMQVLEMDFTGVDEPLFALSLAVNTTAELFEGSPIGNPTEGSLLLWLASRGYDYAQLRGRAKILSQEPFSTERKYMLTEAEIDGRRHVFMKGAPEIISSRCAVDDELAAHFNEKLSCCQQRAMRTLAFAVDGKMVGVAAISDPVRKEVPKAVKACLDAGIELKVVTGDTSATAVEIARQIGIWNDGTDSLDEEHVTGEAFAALDDGEAMRKALRLKVMSRARPDNKQRLVKLLQQAGKIVAVTGDGTNDAPALNHAHVGVSLGSGTSVARQASDITLIDDSFQSLSNAVMWGRSLYKNIQRFVYFQLVVNLTVLILVLAASLLGTSLPLTITQILWVNLIMDTFAALALASLPPSRIVMKDSPRNPSEFIITKRMMKYIMTTSAIFSVMMLGMFLYCEYGAEPGFQLHELTMFFTTFVMLQFWNLFNAKTLGTTYSALRNLLLDKGLLLVLALILGGQWLIVTFGGEMFRTVPLTWKEWLKVICCTSVVLWGGELWRLWQRRKSRT